MSKQGAEVVALPCAERAYQGRLTEAIRDAINAQAREWPLTYVDILGALQVVTAQVMQQYGEDE